MCNAVEPGEKRIGCWRLREAHRRREAKHDGESRHQPNHSPTDVFGEVLRRDASVVHEYVETFEFLDSGVNGCKDLIKMRDVHLQWHHAPAERFDLAREPAVGIAVPQSQSYIGARVRHRKGDGAAETSR